MKSIFFSLQLGLKGSPDIAAAEKVAKFIGTKHYSFTFTVQQGLHFNAYLEFVRSYDYVDLKITFAKSFLIFLDLIE